jgi:hypothetical protein
MGGDICKRVGVHNPALALFRLENLTELLNKSLLALRVLTEVTEGLFVKNMKDSMTLSRPNIWISGL